VIGSYKVEFGGTFFILRPFFDLKIPLMYVALINVKIEGLNLIGIIHALDSLIHQGCRVFSSDYSIVIKFKLQPLWLQQTLFLIQFRHFSTIEIGL
jgi:hypothetical protein